MLESCGLKCLRWLLNLKYAFLVSSRQPVRSQAPGRARGKKEQLLLTCSPLAIGSSVPLFNVPLHCDVCMGACLRVSLSTSTEGSGW